MTDTVFTIIASGVFGLLGAAIGGWFTLYAGKKAHQRDVVKQVLARKEYLKGYLQALHEELSTLWTRYMNILGQRVEELEKYPGMFHSNFVLRQVIFQFTMVIRF